MLKRLGILLLKDIVIGSKNYFTIIVLFTAVLMAVIVSFVIPENASIEPAVYYRIHPPVEEVFSGITREGSFRRVESRLPRLSNL